MKLSFKIALAMALMTAAILLFLGWMTVQREKTLMEADMARDARLVAESIASLIEHAPELDPEDKSLERLLRAVDREEGEVSVRWVSLPDHTDSEMGEAWLRAMRQGHTYTFHAQTRAGQSRLNAIAPVQRAGLPGVVWVSESLAARDAAMARLMGSTALSIVLVTLFSGAVALVIGRALVGQRVDLLVEKAQCEAHGEHGFIVPERGGDELALLATAMNRMGRDLVQAQAEVARETEARLQAEVQLRHADRLTTVGQLAAGIAHELGTPLNVVMGRAQLLQRRVKGHADAEADARVIREQSDRITTIIRRLLDFSRRSTPDICEENLGRIAEEAVDLLAATARRSDVEVAIEVQAQPAPMVAVDRGQMVQVITNLLLNAIQAMAEGGHLWVRVARGTCQEPAVGEEGAPVEHVHLSVQDDGPGIPPQVLERIFDPFFTTKEPGEGTGLGLAVVHGILQDHGGHITVQVGEAGGTTFTVHLPVSASPPQPADTGPRTDHVP